jgi:hypothetical protein
LFCSGTSQKTYVAIKRHKGEVAGAVVVDNTGLFVGEGTKTKYIGNGFIVDIINEDGLGFVIIVFIRVIRNDARYEGMIACWGTRKGWTRLFVSCALQAFARTFHVAF